MHPYKSVYWINFDVATELIAHGRQHLFGKCRGYGREGAINPATRHAASAPISTLAPATKIASHRKVCASIPIRMGIGSICHGMA